MGSGTEMLLAGCNQLVIDATSAYSDTFLPVPALVYPCRPDEGHPRIFSAVYLALKQDALGCRYNVCPGAAYNDANSIMTASACFHGQGQSGKCGM